MKIFLFFPFFLLLHVLYANIEIIFLFFNILVLISLKICRFYFLREESFVKSFQHIA